MHQCLARWPNIFEEYRNYIVYRPGLNNKPYGYLSRLKDRMNQSEKASKATSKVPKVQLPQGNEYETNLEGLMKFLGRLKLMKFDLEHKNFVPRSQKSSTLWDGNLIWHNKACLRL